MSSPSYRLTTFVRYKLILTRSFSFIDFSSRLPRPLLMADTAPLHPYREAMDASPSRDSIFQPSVGASTVFIQKRARQAVEQDALRLYNRVRALEKEEDRAARRIDETRRRAQEILAQRQRNDEKQRDKELRLRQLQLEIAKQRAAIAEMKDESRRAREEQERAVLEQRIEGAMQVKETKIEMQRELERARLMQRKKALEMKEFVLRQKEVARKRIDEKRAVEASQAQSDYERRLQDEIERRLLKERELEKLAQLEMDLIDRLKRKQSEQEEVYQDLDSLLASGMNLSKSSLRGSGPTTPRANATRGGGGGTAGKKPSSSSAVKRGNNNRPTSTTTAKAGSKPTASTNEQASTRHDPSDEDVARAFSKHDADGEGIMPTELLGRLMADLHSPLNDVQLAQAVSQLDPKQTGKVDFGTFLYWFHG